MLYSLYLLVERRREGEGRVSVETIFPRRVPQFQGFWSQEIPLPESARAEIVELDGRLWWRQAILQRALFPFEPGERSIEAAEADLRLVVFPADRLRPGRGAGAPGSDPPDQQRSGGERPAAALPTGWFQRRRRPLPGSTPTCARRG